MSKTFRYRNSDSHRRTWGRIQRPDGRTLELEADEAVDLEQEVDAAFLEPMVPVTRAPRKRSARPRPKNPSPAKAAPEKSPSPTPET